MSEQEVAEDSISIRAVPSARPSATHFVKAERKRVNPLASDTRETAASQSYIEFIDEQSREPIPEVRVLQPAAAVCQPGASYPLWNAISKKDGVATLWSIPPGRYRLHVFSTTWLAEDTRYQGMMEMQLPTPRIEVRMTPVLRAALAVPPGMPGAGQTQDLGHGIFPAAHPRLDRQHDPSNGAPAARGKGRGAGLLALQLRTSARSAALCSRLARSIPSRDSCQKLAKAPCCGSAQDPGTAVHCFALNEQGKVSRMPTEAPGGSVLADP